MNFTFRAHERLSRSLDFVRARRAGNKRVGRHLVLWVYRREEEPPRVSRLGISVGRENGGAVQRNRFKRRVREIFRLHKHLIARGWDFVVSPKRKASRTDFPPLSDELRIDFLNLAKPQMKTETKTEE